MNTEERKQLNTLCLEFPEIFYDERNLLSSTNRVKHQISTTDEIPVYTDMYLTNVRKLKDKLTNYWTKG